MISPTLDIDAVAAFLGAADLRSFTRAAEALGTTQSLVSTRVKRLEEVLGHVLLQRHPRLVRLTSEGERFVPAARELLAAHERARAAFALAPERITLGISEQAVGPDAPALLARLAGRDPTLVITLRIERSSVLEEGFERGEFDAVVTRRVGTGRSGEVLRRDAFGWFASPALNRPAEAPLPLVTLVAECGLRRHAVARLERAGIAWREAFSGGGMAAVLAAIQGGLGVSPLAAHIAPPGAVDIGEAWGLPALGASELVLRSNVATPRGNALVRELAAAFRGAR
jgi:DNA-binding transcriptional LysR family regulator